MFRSLRNAIGKTLQATTYSVEARRSTFILRRKNQTRLNRMETRTPRKLKTRDYIYELVEDTDLRKAEMVDLVLIKNVENIGNAGEVISVKKLMAYEYFILTGAGKVATPENIQKYSSLKREDATPVETQKLLETLKYTHVPVFMHPSNPWTLKPWHISLALQKHGIICPEEYIQIPEKQISGPDFDIEKKDFVVKVTVSKTFVVPIRCRLFHMVFAESHKSISFRPTFYNDPISPIFPEEKEVLESIPVKVKRQSKGIVILEN